MKSIEQVLSYLDNNEIDYRLESNFCVGYVFYFLDSSVYPRRYFDYELEGLETKVIAETVDNLLVRATNKELKKDWLHRVEGADLKDTFRQVWDHIKETQS